jgi:hypothetical protein
MECGPAKRRASLGRGQDINPGAPLMPCAGPNALGYGRAGQKAAKCPDVKLHAAPVIARDDNCALFQAARFQV